MKRKFYELQSGPFHHPSLGEIDWAGKFEECVIEVDKNGYRPVTKVTKREGEYSRMTSTMERLIENGTLIKVKI